MRKYMNLFLARQMQHTAHAICSSTLEDHLLSKIRTSIPPHLIQKFIKTYSNAGDLVRARHLFDKIPEPDLPTSTVLISGYTKHGFPDQAVNLYSDLRKQKLEPDKMLLASMAKACGSLGDVGLAKALHEDAVQLGFNSDLLVANSLIDMYGKCKCIDGAMRVFDDMLVKDVISWTSMCSCFVNCGQPNATLGAFRDMGLNGVRPNSITLSSVLPACAYLKNLKAGREIHGFVVKQGIDENLFVSSGLVSMYASCLCLKQAQMVFDRMSERDIVSWNVIITSYFSNKECETALDIFYRMRSEGVNTNYASWNAVIGGCVQNGLIEQGLEMLSQMQMAGFKPNRITIASILPACSNLESLRGGKEVHGYIYRHWFVEDLMAMTALIFMYGKCGVLDHSRRVFSMMARRDIVAWNIMILANSMHGNGDEALALFHELLKCGLEPNSFTFTSVLSGCSHSKLVDEGLSLFNSMSKAYSIEPDSGHYACMVDVLSRGGRLQEAYEFIQKVPVEATASAWGALLGASRVYKNVEMGLIAAERLFDIEPENAGNYVLLYNILATAKLWDKASEVRKLMRDRGITKEPGCSWVHVRDKVYTFVVGDKSIEHGKEIYRFLDDIGEKMRLAGFKSNTDFVLQDLDQEEKEEALCNHSEKLAVAFGLLNLNGETSIRVFKNLRICGDCHNFIKFMTRIVAPQIIVRDSLRFHHFKDGVCSCQDFW